VHYLYRRKAKVLFNRYYSDILIIFSIIDIISIDYMYAYVYILEKSYKILISILKIAGREKYFFFFSRIYLIYIYVYRAYRYIYSIRFMRTTAAAASKRLISLIFVYIKKKTQQSVCK
jgi:hypothetical protein